MEAEERPIFATLAYYGALRWPLTAVEIAQRLIPPARLGAPELQTDVGAVVALTERLAADGNIRASGGLYIVGDHPVDLSSYRIRRHAISADKWHHMLGAAWWLQLVPNVRMLAASGSLALGNSSEQSDWDMFVVVRAGRLYTARLGLLIVARLLGRLRTKGMRTSPDRFCFNHIVTTDDLAIRHRSLFTAHAISWLMPFYDPWDCSNKLRQSNQWVTDYVSTSIDSHFEHRTLAKSGILNAIRWVGEALLNTIIGNAIESIVRRWMQKRIEREPATHARGGRIVADELEIEFHPHSFEAVALRRYNDSLVGMGLGQFVESDSGLK